MNESDRDFDNWVKALQGDVSADDPMATAVREAIRAERAVEEMRLQPEIELAEQRLLARLRREGLLQKENLPSKLPRRRKWSASIAVAATIFLGIGIANFAHFQGGTESTENPDTVVRGEAMPVLVMAQPEVVVENLARELEKLGAKTRTVSINESEFMLRIGVPAEANNAAILQLLQENGIRPEGPAPYRISFKKK